ncbi:MAG TPA: phosphatase PAP2 family protein [Ramlibacter sp.]|uniref:phosphatase PAP2 family protein n=1 Tax=Ramlibacter sp. TaxID=1917967 RepID=UPI002D80E808|nr:phosphatase PAP2 family protein [Ramlibacter sp.]HET8748300.1 phosphatase PAP2 family protein [Ramlibacter sp.]
MSSLQVPLPRALSWLSVGGLALVSSGMVVHLTGADAAWLLQLHARVPGPIEALAWSCLTVLGLGWCALIFVLAADRGDGWLGALLLPTFVVGALSTHAVKWLLAVPRPAGTALLPQLHVIGAAFRAPVSMPSGHALTAAATAALLCLVVPGSRAALRWLLAGAAVAISVSRVVVGAHWPSDILVGAGMGLLAVGLCLAACEGGIGRGLHERLARSIATPTGQRWVALAEVAAAVGLLEERTGYPAARPVVLAMALFACTSAGWRWRAAREVQPPARLADAPVERT